MSREHFRTIQIDKVYPIKDGKEDLKTVGLSCTTQQYEDLLKGLIEAICVDSNDAASIIECLEMVEKRTNIKKIDITGFRKITKNGTYRVTITGQPV